MKKLLKLATLLFAFASITFVGCNDPYEDWVGGFDGGVGLMAGFKSATATTISIDVETKGLSSIAYMAVRTDNLTSEELAALSAPHKMVLFAKGTNKEVKNGVQTVTVENLSPNATYNIYLIGEIASSAELMKDVVTLSGAQTGDFEGEYRITTNYRGFTVDVKVPDRVKEEKHLIKWGSADLFLYNKNKLSVKGVIPDSEIINLNDDVYGQFFFDESTTIVANETASLVYDENGDVSTYLYEAIVPGQPQVFILGEFKKGQSDFGWGLGHYVPLFNYSNWAIDLAAAGGETVIDETPYWTGMYINELIQIDRPIKLDDSLLDVQLEIGTSDATVRITADESIENVCILMLGDGEYTSAMGMLNNNPDYMQWFATSMVAQMEGVSATFMPWEKSATSDGNGHILTALSDYFLTVEQSSHYWIYVVGLRGDLEDDGWLDGYEQVCWKQDFDLKQTTLPPAELVVTPIETEAGKAVYNIKCPTKDAVDGYWIANYEKDWLSSGMTPKELIDNYAKTNVDQYGKLTNAFASVEIDYINSDEGLTVDFSSRPHERFHFAAMVTNSEGTPTYSAAIVCNVPEPAVEKVESPYFETLQGEWTASAYVKYGKLIENNDENAAPEYEMKEGTHTSKVVLGDLTYPEVLPESVYETFEAAGVSREDTDVYYGELCEVIDLFNQNNRDHNRILAGGFDFSGELLPYCNYCNYKSAYDLFISESYNGWSSATPVQDFGPKWYIEVKADGTLGVPFNSEYFTPVGNWSTNSYGSAEEVHLLAYEPESKTPAAYLTGSDEEGNFKAVTGYFPVEISDDGNTITIKPYIHTDNSGKEYRFYPNLGVYTIDPETYQPLYNISFNIVSDIVLTRGAAATPAQVSARNFGGSDKPVIEKVQTNAPHSTKRAILKSRTAFEKFSTPLRAKIDHSATPEERAEAWLKAWGRDAK